MSLIDKARESEINSYFKLEEDYQSLVDHAQALERQLAEAREEVEMLKDIKERMFEMLNLAYCNHDGFKPLFESLCKMIKEQLKEQG